MTTLIPDSELKPNFIPTNKGKIATYSVGKGQPIIFLHGGPGDTHHYMRRMAEPLTSKFQCIFFDQRGTGQSEILNRTSNDFTLELLFEDLVFVKNYYKAETAFLVGHSWGAMYALFASLKFPSFFPRAALLNMGPLDDEMGVATSNNLLAALSASEKERWSSLRKERNAARESSRHEDILAADKEMMRLRVNSWIFNPTLRESFLEEYFQDPPPDREVNKWIWEAIQGWFSWDELSATKVDYWLCVGRNDAVPVEQGSKFIQLAAATRMTVFENCGHIPWLEYPDRFYSELTAFMMQGNRALSLGFRTEMIFHRFDGLVMNRENYMVVKTPSMPGFFFGNFILFFEAPKLGLFTQWKSIFRHEFQDSPEVKHYTFLWDSPSEGIGNVTELENEDFKVDFSVVLTTSSVHAPPKSNSLVEVRPIKSDEEWKEVIEAQIRSKAATSRDCYKGQYNCNYNETIHVILQFFYSGLVRLIILVTVLSFQRRPVLLGIFCSVSIFAMVMKLIPFW